jgi:crotonobetainyl-CoA:carnitine CoA-transferase CaiB-like acyl-CoA transferase
MGGPPEIAGSGMGNPFVALKVLSVEQALALPYLTYRLALEGMQVLRVETPPYGDPNRSAGPQVLKEKRMNAYFLPFNCGKRAITLNLKTEEGREILYKLIDKNEIDIFACNQLPNRYMELGIDYESIRKLRKGLIWLGLTGYGPEVSERAYDPIIQAKTGLLGLTGDKEGMPFVCGVSVSDISASENGYGQVMKALYKREVTGEGSRIDVSLLFSTLTYQIINITMNKNFGTRIERTGNSQRFFAPASVYQTADGFVYLAIGNDGQFRALCRIQDFQSLEKPEFKTNQLRVQNKVQLNDEIKKLMRSMTSDQVSSLLSEHKIPVAKVLSIEDVAADPLVNKKMLKAKDPQTGLELNISPPPNATDYLAAQEMNIGFAPRLGEHNEQIYREILGFGDREVLDLKERGII